VFEYDLYIYDVIENDI